MLRLLHGGAHDGDANRVDGDGGIEKIGSLTRARWWNEPATLPALGRERKEASVKTSRMIDDGRKTFMPLGCIDAKPRRRSKSAMVLRVRW